MIPEKIRLPVVGVLIGLVSLTVPLLRDFHWESAGLASFVGTLYAGLLSSNNRNSTARVLYYSSGLVTGWAFPLIVYTIYSGCFTVAGLGFWVFGPFPSIIFGWATGRIFANMSPKRSRWYTTGTLMLFATLPTLAEFLNFPQLYFFNHVWSYWPGPIYDEVVNFDLRLVLFRSITLLWSFMFLAIPSFFQFRINRVIVFTSFAALLFSHFHMSEWGLIAPEARIQEKLGSFHETDHFRIFYSGEAGTRDDAEDWGAMHERYLSEITAILEVDSDYYDSNRIHSYIYSGSDEKKEITGAGQTSFVPVWLGQDQTHISVEALPRVLKHELVHIVAKQFGNRFGASSSIGLVEGLAVAIAPERYDSTADKLVAARPVLPDVVELRRLLNPAGFYSSSGPASYVITGSFVAYLITDFPVELMKQAYRSGNLEAAYKPETLPDLVSGWHSYLEAVEVGSVDRQLSMSVFSTPSLFEKPCPRVQTKREIRDIAAYNSGGETTGGPITCS